MKHQEAINQIRLNLKKLLNFADEKKFNNYTLSDGTNITCTSAELEIGSEVYQLDDQGNQTPLDNGEYVLQDGRTFTIVDNKVTELKAIEEVEETESGKDEVTSVENGKQKLAADGLPEGQDKEQKDEDKPEADDQESGDLSSRVEDLERIVAELMNIINKAGDTQNDLNEQMMSKLVKLGAEPAEKSIKASKNTFEIYDSKKSTANVNDEVTSRLLQLSREKSRGSKTNYNQSKLKK